MAKEWDKVNMKRETAEAFQQYAKSLGTTVGTYLRGEAPTPDARHSIPWSAEHQNKLGRVINRANIASPQAVLTQRLGDFFGWKRQLHSILEYDRPAFLTDGGRNSRPVACLEVCDFHKAIGILRVLKHTRHLVCKAERAVLAAKEIPLPHFFSTFGTFHDRTFFYSLDF